MNGKVLAGLVLVGGVVLGACGSDGGSDDDGATGFSVFPTRVFSGHDGKNTYRAPITAENATSEVEWTISDPTIADLAPDGDNNRDVMVITKKAGNATITAKHGSTTKTIPLRVYAYEATQWEAGRTIYEMGKGTDTPACKMCHAEGRGPNHTPSEVDRDEDEDLIQIIQTGTDPEDNPEEPARIVDRKEFEQLLNGKTHEWKVTDDEAKGLVAYIRSLMPSGRPALSDD